MKTVLSLLEKVVMTYLQSFIALLLVGSSLDLSVATSASVAAIPAGLTVLANGIPAVPVGLNFYLDLVLRTVRTYAVTFLGLLLAMPVFHLDLGVGKAAAIGAIPAALAVLKGAVAGRLGAQGTAALLPAALDPRAG